MGLGTLARWRRELGRPSPARRLRAVAPVKARPISGASAGKWAGAGWASEAAVVPLEPSGQQNPRRGKGRCFVCALRTGKGWRVPVMARTAEQETVRDLQRTLYRAAKADPG
jgi:hypothetical protein